MENQGQIDLFLFLGILAFIGLALLVAFIFMKHKSKMLVEVFKSASEAEERQKDRIAKNLHDEITPILTAVKRSLGKNIKDFGTTNFNIGRLQKDLEFVEQTISSIREITHDLMPETLKKLGLIKSLQEYIEGISEIGNSRAELDNKLSYEAEVPFSIADQRTIYRICLELINNLLKHAHYSELKLTIEKINNNMEIVLMHNGKGVTNEEIEKLTTESAGLGLKSLKSRVLILNGNLNYFIQDGIPSIILSIPIKNGKKD